jgi:hypothetical protein
MYVKMKNNYSGRLKEGQRALILMYFPHTAAGGMMNGPDTSSAPAAFTVFFLNSG